MTLNHSETGSTDVGKPGPNSISAHTDAAESTATTTVVETSPPPSPAFNAEDPAIPLPPVTHAPPSYLPSASSSSSAAAHAQIDGAAPHAPHHTCTACLRKKTKPASLRFTVQTVMGAVYTVKCRETDTFSYLTFKLYAKTGLRPDRQRLVLDERELVCDEEWTLKECGLRNGCVLTLAPFMAAGFVTHLRSTEKPSKQKVVQPEVEEETVPAPKRRDASWWREKQTEHDTMRTRMEELKQKMAEKKKKAAQ